MMARGEEKRCGAFLLSGTLRYLPYFRYSSCIYRRNQGYFIFLEDTFPGKLFWTLAHVFYVTCVPHLVVNSVK